MKGFARTLAHALLHDAPDLRVERCTIVDETVTVTLRATAMAAPCPMCDQVATRVHSHYHRTLADLPWSGCAVQLHLSVRKFCCVTPTCPRRIFT